MADNTENETGFSETQIRTIAQIVAAALAQDRAQNQNTPPSEIPASAYTPEMEVLGALPDIPMFDDEPVSPRFPPAMRYALMERWNDCTHTFVFGFGEMTLTLVDYAAITGLRFTGPVPPLDTRYQTAAIRAQLFRSLLGVTTQTRYTVQGGGGGGRRPRRSSAVSRLQAKVERLRTRLEVEGIPLDSSDEDEGGSSSDDESPSPPPPTVVGPSRRRR
ncbi:hypothetical protein JCGZ_10955 [Jatropha curcas]|uniref:Aminotransferase-like plant mobile domain-containing protein n=1 Tax=Jatropha curcas TaxID=180498 RepID=A0A067KH90_JATCU|nr:hypothetical protein JCGZ_10955 [Jatropha curcas]